MSEPFSAGDVVRVADPERFTTSFAKKIRDRDATVERCFQRQGSQEWTVVLMFHKRGNRGKAFKEYMHPRYLEMAK